MEDYIPKIVCFSCAFGWGYLADKRTEVSTIDNLISTACVGKIDSVHILEAFKAGADGVLLLGCPEEHCHFQDGNFQAGKRVYLLQKTIQAFGIEPERLEIRFSRDPDCGAVPKLLDEMRVKLTKLGPIRTI